MTKEQLLYKHIEYRGVVIEPLRAPKGHITRMGDLIVGMPKAKSFLDAISEAENMIDNWFSQLGEWEN